MFSLLPWMLTTFVVAAPQSPSETLLLQSPTVSDQHVVFVYAADLWIVDRDGGEARRLTSDRGVESSPRLSPDGSWVAYSAQYDGNTDVYLMNIRGGTPQRLTWHPGRDTVQDWQPEGGRILFTSARDTGTGVTRLFEVDTSGRHTPRPLPIPRAARASYSPDGSKIAYTPYRDAFWSWKRYRGGRVTRIWIYDTATHAVEEIPRENASDSFPAYLGSDVYFCSDRTGRMALYRFEPGSAAPELCSTDAEFDVRSLSAGGGVVAFERAGAIHLFDPETQSVRRLSIRVMSDGLSGRPRWQSVEGHVRNAHLSPNGKRAVFEARGEIVTVPREHGGARNLTRTSGVHERNPAWSPDGEKIAWFSDEGGEYQLRVGDRLGKEAPRSFALGDGGFYYGLQWSPDNRHVLFQDKRNRLAYVTLETAQVTTVTTSEGSLGVVWIAADWSPDSQWIAFESRNSRTLYDRIALYRCSDRSITPITDGFGEASDPSFSSDGKLLFFTASVESGPTRFGLDMEASAARTPRNHLYTAVLQRDGKDPFGPRDDAGIDSEESHDEKDDQDRPDDRDRNEKKKPRDIPQLDLDGIDQRIVAVPLPSGRYRSLEATDDALYFLNQKDGETELVRFDLEEREEKTVASEVRSYQLSQDEKSMLLSVGTRWEIRSTSGDSDRHPLAIDNVKVRVVPAEEWPQILREAWRIERDYFYDPQMHGVDWDAMWTRWSSFLPHVRHRAELTVLLAEMIGELACGHNYVSGGEYPDAEDGVPTGLLGADFVEAGNRFRLERILRGQNWNPDLRAPLTAPGVDVEPGDYLIAVDGVPLFVGQNFYAAFENTVDRPIDLTWSSSQDGSNPRTTTVVPIGSDRSLRRLSWVEANRRRVDELSGGRLAYVYMPNTGRQGMSAFDRDYYSQLDKQGLILDERFNGGGMVADYVVHVLARQTLSFWMNRELWVGRSPFGLIPGPKVMVINERAGSGGDWMPWAFQRMGLGPLVGTRTWGGLVGISGYPPLMDGGRVTAASFGVMDPDGNWAVENVGVAPDVEVIQWPAEVIAGRDPQLERAVQIALRALEQNPPKPLPEYKPPTKR